MLFPSALSISKNIWFTALIAFVILFGGLFILQQVPLVKKDAAATGLLADMVITFPLVYYFLLIRPLKLRKWKIVFVFTCCCAVAYISLPAHQQYYVLQLRKLTALAELGIVIYAISKVRRIVTIFNKFQTTFPDFAYNLSKSMTTVLGNNKPVKLLASELTILRFGLFCWKKPRQTLVAISRFSGYKESGYSSLFGVLLFVFIVELAAVHLLLIQYSIMAALIVSLISFYGIIFIVADFSAIVKSPVLIMNDKLLLRTGIRWLVQVNINNIASIEKIKESYQADKDCFNGGILKSSVNILFTFKHPVSVERIYRNPIKFNKIIMSIDQANDFLANFRTQLSKESA